MSDVSYPSFSEMRVLTVPDESSSRTIDYYAVDHFYTSLFRFIVGFDPRLPSHTNSIKLYHLTTVARQIDLLTAYVSWIFTQLLWRPSVRPSVRLSVSQSAPYDVVNDFATKLHNLCKILKYIIFKYTFPASNEFHAMFRRTAMLVIATCCMVCVSLSFVRCRTYCY